MPNIIALCVVLILAAGASSAHAQGGVVPEPNVAEQQGDNEPEGGFDWGWLGLIGLAGLAGLMGRRR